MNSKRKILKAGKFAVALTATWCAMNALAAPCRSQAAASTGATTGYNVDIQAADATEQQDKSASDILGQCVAGITGTMTIPTFPSIDDILNQIKNEICRIASQKVHQAAGNVSAEINAAMRGVTPNSGPITIPPPSVSTGSGSTSSMNVTTAPTSAATTTGNSDWWGRIWR